MGERGMFFRVLSIIIALALVVGSLPFTGTVYASDDESIIFEVYEDVEPTTIVLDDSITVPNGLGTESILVQVTEGVNDTSAQLGFLSDDDATAYGALTMEEDILYYGLGGGEKIEIGYVHSELNGEDGTHYMINFHSLVENGGFDSNISGWEVTNEKYEVSGDTGDEEVGDYDWFYTSPTYKASHADGFDGFSDSIWYDDTIMYAEIVVSLEDENGTVHGPSVESSTFSAKTGDSIAFDVVEDSTVLAGDEIVDISDSINCYYYLVDGKTGAKQLLVHDTDYNYGWERQKYEINLPSSDDFYIEIIFGMRGYEEGYRTQWRYIGVDTVSVISQYVDEALMSEVASRITFTSEGEVPGLRYFEIYACNPGFYESSFWDSFSLIYNTHYFKAYLATDLTLLSEKSVDVRAYPIQPVATVTALSSTALSLDVDIEVDEYTTTWADTYDIYIKEGEGIYTVLEEDVAKADADVYTVTGLSPNTAYKFKLIGSNMYGESDNGYTDTVYTLPGVPFLTNSVTEYTPSQFLISNNGNGEGTLYELERSTDGGVTYETISSSLEANGEESQFFYDTDALINSVNYYRIRAYSLDGFVSDYSDVLVKTTGGETPTGLTLANAEYDGTIQNLTWNQVADADYYKVYQNGVAVESVTSPQAEMTGLTPNTYYEYTVRGGIDTGLSYDSQAVSAYAYAATPSITFYEGASDTTTNSIKFSIYNEDNPTNTDYILERKEGDGSYEVIFVIYNFSGYEIETMSYGTEYDDYMDTDLKAGTKYTYRVKAVNESGVESPYSELVERYTLPEATESVTGIAKEEVLNNIILEYDAPVGAFYYDIYRLGPGEYTSLVSQAFDSYTLVATDVQSTIYEDVIDDLDFATNKTYMYYVVARNSSGESVESMKVNVFSNADVPSHTDYAGGINTTNLGSNVLQVDIKDDVNPDSGDTEYYLEYQTDIDETWTGVTGEWQNFKEGTQMTVDPERTYTFRVKARNGDGVESAYSLGAVARDNTEPTMVITSPSEVTYKSEEIGFNEFVIQGTVYDENSDTVKITATLDGSTKTIFVPADSDGETFTIVWDILEDGINEGDYGSITLNTDDGYGGEPSFNTAYLLRVDKTSPDEPTSDVTGTWTKEDSVTVNLTMGADTLGGAGTSYVMYSLQGATTADWTTYTEPIVVTATGITTIVAKTVDVVGNLSAESSHEVKIDHIAPVFDSFLVYDTATDVLGYTSVDTVTLKEITGSDNVGLSQILMSQSDDFALSLPVAYSDTVVAGIAGDEGNNTLYVKLLDEAGNESATLMTTVIKDSTAPVVTVSKPSQYTVAKEGSVSFTVTTNEEGTFNIDTSDVSLTSIGSVTYNLGPLENNIVIQDVDALTKLVVVTIPADYEESGGFGITIGDDVSLDALENASSGSSSPSMCILDTLAPVHQDLMMSSFEDMTTLKGGEVISLDMASIDYDLSLGGEAGSDTDVIFLAPEGYTGEPANGTTITSTHGSSSMINAPLNEGHYYLYIMDSSSNISNQSLKMISVDNEGPGVTISSPSPEYVNSGASSEFEISYTTDAAIINLSEEDVTLKTTGTANAYVAIDDNNTVRLYNISGEGTIAIKVLEGVAEDDYGNESDATAVSDVVNVDNTDPEISSFEITSDNEYTDDYVGAGDVVTVEFTVNEDIQTPVMTFDGNVVTVNAVDGGSKTYTASYTLTGSESYSDDDYVDFVLQITDMTGNSPSDLTAIDFDERLQVDKTAPTISYTGNKQAYIQTDAYDRYVTVEVLDDHTPTRGTYSYNGGDLVAFTTQVTLSEVGSYTINAYDGVGNSLLNETLEIDNLEYQLLSELNQLEVVYQGDDYEDSVTEDVILRTENYVSDVTIDWSVVTGTAISDTGVVTRPAYGSDDEAVGLRVTVSKDGQSLSEDYNLIVTAQLTEDPDLEIYYENLNKARIVYESGDAAESVTNSVYLSVKGVTSGGAIEWRSSDESILAPGEAMNDYWYETTLNRPSEAEGDQAITMTALVTIPEERDIDGTVTRAEEEITKVFNLVIKAYGATAYEKLRLDYDELEITLQGDDYYDEDTYMYVVTQDALLSYADGVTTARGTDISWTATDSDLVDVAGGVTRPLEDEVYKYASLTVTMSQDGYVMTKIYNFKILPEEASEDITEDGVAISYFDGNGADNVYTHVVLPEVSDQGNRVTWTSDDETTIATDGLVSRGEVVKVVNLQATITNSNNEETVLGFALTVIGIGTDDFLTRLTNDTDSLELVYDDGNYESAVSENLGLFEVGSCGSDIEWESSYPEIVATTGAVNRGTENTTVTLTAYVNNETDGSAGETVDTVFTVGKYKTFQVLVLGESTKTLEEDDVDIIYAIGDSANSVTGHLFLTTESDNGNTVTWSSNDTDTIKDSTGGNECGEVTRPSSGDKEVVLIATIEDSDSGNTLIKAFELTVKAEYDYEEEETEEDLVNQDAADLTFDTAFVVGADDYWESITSEFLAVSRVYYGNGSEVQWASSNETVLEIVGENSENSNYINIAVNRQEDDVQVILTATIGDDDYSATKEFLMIVKGNDSTEASVRVESEEYDVSIKATSDESQAGEYKSVRTTIEKDGESTEIIDVLSLDGEDALEAALTAFNTSGDQSLTLDFYKDEMAGSALQYNQGIELDEDAVETLGQQDVNMVVETNMGNIEISSNLFRNLAETGSNLRIYFGELSDDGTAALQADVEALAGSTVTVYSNGLSMIMNTPSDAVDSTLILPFSTIPDDLSNLGAYIKHHDGEEEFVEGTLVLRYGEPYGISIDISKYSEFIIADISELGDLIASDDDDDDDDSSSGTNAGNTLTIPAGTGTTTEAELDGVIVTIPPEVVDQAEGDTVVSVDLDGDDISLVVEDVGDEGTQLITSFNKAIQLYFEVTEEEAMNITTAVRNNADGTQTHIPTYIMRDGDTYYVLITTFVSGDFSLIYNPMTFEDVEGYWAEDNINNMYSRTVVHGYPDGTYQPSESITRAEFTKIIITALGFVPEEGELTFEDVSEDNYFAPYIYRAVELGLVKGYSDERFGPNDEITREQCMTIIYRLFSLTDIMEVDVMSMSSEILAAFKDVDDISYYALEAVVGDIYYGIVKGRSEDYLDPKEYVTRAEAIVMIERFLKETGMID